MVAPKACVIIPRALSSAQRLLIESGDHVRFFLWLVRENTERWIPAADGRPPQILCRLVNIGFQVVEILTGIGGLVLASFDEPEEAGCQDTAQARAKPVDPVLTGE